MTAGVIVRRNFIIWCFIYIVFAWMAYRVSMVQQGLTFHEFLYGNLFNLQKYFFDVSILFFSFLYIMKKPFASTMFVSRCRENYLLHILIYGLKICLFYIGLTITLFVGVPIVANTVGMTTGNIRINVGIMFSFFNLFAFLFTAYQLYVLVLLMSGKQVLSVISGYCANLIIFAINIVLRTIDEVLMNHFESFILSSYAGFAIIVMLITFLFFRRKDFLM